MPLLDLPTELLLRLFELLDWPSLKQTRSSTRRILELIPEDALGKHYTDQKRLLYEDEQRLLRKIMETYWEEAEDSFLGYHSSSYTSSSLDPDLRAHEERYNCVHHTLPCYHCLTWKPSVTDAPAFANSSGFSRGMSTGSRNLGSKHALSRICIDCGIRTRMYNRGSIVKHSGVCYSCRALTVPFNSRVWNDRLTSTDRDWLLKWLCQSCFTHSKYSTLTREQFNHELRWERYESSMADGKMYRLVQGMERRQQQANGGTDGCGTTVAETLPCDTPYKKPRYCPTMKELRFCNCSTTI